ncbi:MAG: hypothetical protein EOM34_00015 [Clostridia bacterium]|nr:phage holin [Lachnospiraceae bacterium]NCB99050.1 hypothetical protein [Clostridia bacterium]NCD03516.1 hypothetical protein [Clostridia bacterium]
MKLNLKGINPSTYVSVIMTVIVAINAVLAILGRPVLNVGEGTVSYVVNGIVAIITVGVMLYDVWKNHSFTDGAQLADEVLDIIKDGKVTKEELQDFIDAHTLADKADENKVTK